MRIPQVLRGIAARSGLAIGIGAMIAGTAVANDWYVDVNAAPGGDGSAAHPFQKIGDGVGRALDGDRVLVAAGTYSELLTLDKSVTILGDSTAVTTVDGGGHGPIITINSGKSVWVQDLTVVGGQVGGAFGQSVAFGGGISNQGSLVGVRMRISGCVAYSTKADAGGGAIDNEGTLLLWSCGVEGCGASTGLNPFTFSSGGAALGGAIYNRGTAKVFNSTLSGNAVATDVWYVAAPSRGGAIYNEGTLRLVNSTISGNSSGSTSAYGGGIDNAATGTLNIDHSTIAWNWATGRNVYTGQGSAFGGGVVGAADIGESVIAYNQVYDDNYGSSSYGPDYSGTCNSLGYLLIGDTTDTTLIGDQTGVQGNVDPKLLPLADNGGFVQTHALDATSPCIDTGNPDALASPAYDARGYPRALWDPRTGASDLGAYEAGGTISFLLTATPDVPLPAGSTLAVTTGGGVFSHPNLLVLVDVNGAPTFSPLLFNTFDQSGVIVIEGSVPNGLSGTTAGLKSFSIDVNGKLEISNEALLTFQ